MVHTPDFSIKCGLSQTLGDRRESDRGSASQTRCRVLSNGSNMPRKHFCRPRAQVFRLVGLLPLKDRESLSARHIAGMRLAEKSGVERARDRCLRDFALFTGPISRHPKSAYVSQGLALPNFR